MEHGQSYVRKKLFEHGEHMTKLQNNLLTQIRDDVQDALADILDFVGVGEDDTTESNTDTALGMEVFRDSVDATDVSTDNMITVTHITEAAEGNNNTIGEAGVFSAQSYVVDDCDAITGWNDSADMTVHLNNTSFWEGTGSIDLTKDNTGSATASTSKTVTSRDFTSQTLSVLLYIDTGALTNLATTSCLTIRYGSDITGATDYYEWQFDKSELAEGKNYVNTMTSANADSTSGTPALGSMVYFYIAITADAAGTTWSDGDFIMDDIKLIGGTMWARGTLNDFDKTDSVILYTDFTLTITVTEDVS